MLPVGPPSSNDQRSASRRAATPDAVPASSSRHTAATQNNSSKPSARSDQLAPRSFETSRPDVPHAAYHSPSCPDVKPLTLPSPNGPSAGDHVAPASIDRAMPRPQVPASRTPGPASNSAK